MEIIIGEGKEKFDKFEIDGNFETLAQQIDMVHCQEGRNFIFRRKKHEKLYTLIEKPDDIIFETDVEFFTYKNPSIISLDKNIFNVMNQNRLDFFIGVNSCGGMKYSVYDVENVDVKEVMKNMLSIDGLGCVLIGESLILWINGRTRTCKVENKILNSKDCKYENEIAI